jgi:uncharacterized phage protein gp47/JayE
MVNIPTINELYTAILADLNSTVQVNIPILGKNLLRGIAAVQAAKLKLAYLTLGILQKNIFVDTADPEASGGTLERWGRIKLGRNPFPAQSGQYTISVTGTVGGIIPASQVFKSDDSSLSPGMLFILDNAYTLVSSPDYITVRALTPGVISKLLVGDTLSATSPISLVDSGPSQSTVTIEVVSPLDAESLEIYRSATLESFRLEAEGGASADYRLWAQDAQGVANSYPYATSGQVNQVSIYVEAILADSIDGKGTPGSTILTSVLAVINQDPDTTLPLLSRGRRPANVIPNILPVSVRQVDIGIVGYVNITPAIQALILSSIQSFVNSVRPFVAAIDVLADRNDLIDSNNIIFAILQAQPGSVFSAVTLKIDGVQMNSFQFLLGDIPYFNPTIIYS